MDRLAIRAIHYATLGKAKSLLIKGHGRLYVLKSILGHKSIVMTQRYAHLSPEFKRTAVNRMDNIWKVGAKPSLAATEPQSTGFRSPSGHRLTPLAPVINGH